MIPPAQLARRKRRLGPARAGAPSSDARLKSSTSWRRAPTVRSFLSLLKLGTALALRRLLACGATVAADVVQVAVLCNYIEARIADRQDCDAIIAAVDAINDKAGCWMVYSPHTQPQH